MPRYYGEMVRKNGAIASTHFVLFRLAGEFGYFV